MALDVIIRRTPERVFRADVAVLGGGPSGWIAALAAAKLGARVLLVERFGFLGGTATAGLVTPIGGFFAHMGNEDIIGGLPRQFVDRLAALGGAKLPPYREAYDPWQGSIYFDPEAYKYLADQLLAEAGVTVLFHTWACGLDMHGYRVGRIHLMSKAGIQTAEANAFVDATGDGDLIAWAGLPHDDDIVQAGTTIIRIAGIDEERAHRAGDPTGVFQAANRRLLERWGIRVPWGHRPGAGVNPGERVYNVTRLLNVDALDNASLTRAEIEGRRQAREVLEVLRETHPGFERAYIAQTSVHVGIRCSRRLAGEYRITQEDALSCRRFDDAVARCSWPIDVHNPAGLGTKLVFLPENGSFTIPMRSLYHRNAANLVTCGRTLSATVEAHGSARIGATCMGTGQAAGVLAALMSKTGRWNGEVPASEVQAVLRSWGTPV